ncbi:hypothetical protein GBA52_027501 [Prunus armeniaca]|nr:hypothetical protein GBA52_027501 [Prunus armeniaca]
MMGLGKAVCRYVSALASCFAIRSLVFHGNNSLSTAKLPSLLRPPFPAFSNTKAGISNSKQQPNNFKEFLGGSSALI